MTLIVCTYTDTVNKAQTLHADGITNYSDDDKLLRVLCAPQCNSSGLKIVGIFFSLFFSREASFQFVKLKELS